MRQREAVHRENTSISRDGEWLVKRVLVRGAEAGRAVENGEAGAVVRQSCLAES